MSKKLTERVEKLEEKFHEMGEEVSKIALEVNKIRNALYIMAAALTAQVPYLKDIANVVKTMLGG